MKTPPNDEPSSAFILLDEDGMIGDFSDIEILSKKRQEAFGIPEGRIEELSEEEGDKESVFVRRRSSCRLFMLPKREVVRVIPDRFNA